MSAFIKTLSSSVTVVAYAEVDQYVTVRNIGATTVAIGIGTATVPDLEPGGSREYWLTAGQSLCGRVASGSGLVTFSGAIGLTQGAVDDRQRILREALGIKGENYPWYSATNAQVMIDGSFYYMLVPFLKGDVITNLHTRINASGSGMTLSKMGVHSLDGQTQLAATADLGTAWQTAGGKTHALASPYTVIADGCLYLGMVAKASTTLPSPMRIVAGFFTYKLAAASHPWGVITGQTDLPATFTPNGDTGSPISYWVGWS